MFNIAVQYWETIQIILHMHSWDTISNTTFTNSNSYKVDQMKKDRILNERIWTPT